MVNYMRWYTLAFIPLGFILRTEAFVSERSLWIDEAMVALNIVERSPARLFEPLDRNQGAPVGFLLATKASVELFGPTEYALRLPAYLASLVGLCAFGFAAHRLMPPSAAPLALVLFAISPHIVSYAAECKQYSSDAAFAAVLLALAAPFFLGPVRLKNWLAFGTVGVASVWCSHPALFVLAGFGVSLLTMAIFRRDRSRILGLILLGGSWLLSFTAVYFINLRHLGHNDYLIQYWAGHFAPLPTSRSGLVWFVDHALAFIHEPATLSGSHLVVGLLVGLVGIAGLIALARIHRWLVFAFIVTVLFTLVSSGLYLYPFAGRLLLFLVPTACVVWGCGANFLASQFGCWGMWLGWLVVVWPVVELVNEFQKPARTEQIQPMLNHVKLNWQSGDRIYVYGGFGDAGAGPAFDFYSPRYAFPAECIIRGGIHRDDPSQYRIEIAKLPAGRIWVLFTHRHRDEESVILRDFASVGSSRLTVSASGASLHLYEIGRQSPP